VAALYASTGTKRNSRKACIRQRKTCPIPTLTFGEDDIYQSLDGWHGTCLSQIMTRDEYGLSYQKGFDITVRFLLSRGAQRENAMELAQGAWVRGWERLHQLREDSTVVTWVNTIALNAFRRAMRKEAPAQEMPEIVSPHGIDMAAIDIHRILTNCRPSERVLFEQQMCGATTEEIAKKQGVTETAIRIRLLRARRATRSRLEIGAARLHRRAVQDAA
jgi:RNA polymerase sigma factor (sigma-70 family)